MNTDVHLSESSAVSGAHEAVIGTARTYPARLFLEALRDFLPERGEKALYVA